jgi:GntR family transcriptional regulator
MAGYHGPTYAMFEIEFGVRMVRAEEKIRAVAADADAGHSAAHPPRPRC